MFCHGRELGVDPGRARSQAYRLPIHTGWYKATVGHNAVLVDGALARTLRIHLDVALDPPLFGHLREQALRDRAQKLVQGEQTQINPFLAGTITIGFIFGAYMTETFRGAILAVPRGQIEAAYAYGMTRLQMFIRILLPQMIRHAIPGFGNNWLVMVKTTALVSIIGLDDMVRKAALAAWATRMPFTFYVVVAINYLIITSISVTALKWLEDRYSLGVIKA